MIAGVADTHAAVWLLFGDARLSVQARDFFEQAAHRRNKIGIATISLVEIICLVEKGRLPPIAIADVRSALENPSHIFQEVPLTALITGSISGIPREQVPDMPDRIVAATAVHLGVPLITCDSRIRASGVQTIW